MNNVNTPASGIAVSRPQTVNARLSDLEKRLEGILTKADNLAIVLSGFTTLSPSVAGNVAASPPGLYSDVFMAIDRLNDICSFIEVALEEASR